MRKMEDLISIIRVKLLITALLYTCVCSSSVEQKIYVELNETVPCVRLLNATHQIGCQSSMSGDTGVLHVLETQSDLDWILSSGPHPPYMVIMNTDTSNINHEHRVSVMMRMKNSSRVSGVAVIVSKTGLAQNFSPHTTCPNQNTGVYSESYGSELANCNVTVWNPLGNGLSYEDFSFPVFALKDENQTQVIRKCYEDHNQRVNGSAPQYPLCAMQLFSHMHAVTDTVTCMRRTDLQNRFSINPEVLCDPLSDFNVWTSTRPLNSSAKGHAANESVVIAAARLDGRSFFWEQAPAAEGTVSGIITLLAAIQALYPVTQEAPPPRNIFFTFFQGEAFDYIGSSKMVYDMEKNDFVIDLKNVHSILEIGQVGLHSGRSLWMHSDPVSRKNDSVNEARSSGCTPAADVPVDEKVRGLQACSCGGVFWGGTQNLSWAFLRVLGKDGDCPSVEVDVVIQAAEIQCGVLNQCTLGFRAQSLDTLAFICLMVSWWKSERNSRVERMILELGKLEDAFSESAGESLSSLKKESPLSSAVLLSVSPASPQLTVHFYFFPVLRFFLPVGSVSFTTLCMSSLSCTISSSISLNLLLHVTDDAVCRRCNHRMESAAAGLSVSVGSPVVLSARSPPRLSPAASCEPDSSQATHVLADHQKSFSNSFCLSQVAQLLYGFLVQKNNSWFRSLLPPEVSKKGVNSILSPGPPQFYIGLGPRVHGPAHSVTRFVQYILQSMSWPI
ncbi:nicastrin-like [Cyprinus carpio]|uniref:Nicastrin n=1 Tax=Cyprinus carpio TaxID=7962 RepID=A0A9Q9W1J0_CYPCA|nr:nicastrin-like [Cyprinus carpio]